jgi:hypothetical protein
VVLVTAAVVRAGTDTTLIRRTPSLLDPAGLTWTRASESPDAGQGAALASGAPMALLLPEAKSTVRTRVAIS